MAKRKENGTAEAVGGAIAAGLLGPALGGGGRLSYLPRLSDRSDIDLSSGFRSNALATCSLLINGTAVEVNGIRINGDTANFEIDGRSYSVELVQSVPKSSAVGRARKTPGSTRSVGAPGEIVSPLPGIVSEILCDKGDTVEVGQLLVRIEAMKMQNNVYADIAGVLSDLLVSSHEEVAAGQLLVRIV